MAPERRKSQTPEHHACKAAIADALSIFQLIEEGLRIYLDNAYHVIERSIGDRMVIRLTIKSLQYGSLRRLLDEFRKYSGNVKLISKLEKLIPQRNSLAHQAFLEMYRTTLKRNDLIKLTKQAKNIHGKAYECSGLLETEIDMIAKLYDEVSDDSKSGKR